MIAVCGKQILHVMMLAVALWKLNIIKARLIFCETTTKK